MIRSGRTFYILDPDKVALCCVCINDIGDTPTCGFDKHLLCRTCRDGLTTCPVDRKPYIPLKESNNNDPLFNQLISATCDNARRSAEGGMVSCSHCGWDGSVTLMDDHAKTCGASEHQQLPFLESKRISTIPVQQRCHCGFYVNSAASMDVLEYHKRNCKQATGRCRVHSCRKEVEFSKLRDHETECMEQSGWRPIAPQLWGVSISKEYKETFLDAEHPSQHLVNMPREGREILMTPLPGEKLIHGDTFKKALHLKVMIETNASSNSFGMMYLFMDTIPTNLWGRSFLSSLTFEYRYLQIIFECPLNGSFVNLPLLSIPCMQGKDHPGSLQTPLCRLPLDEAFSETALSEKGTKSRYQKSDNLIIRIRSCNKQTRARPLLQSGKSLNWSYINGWEAEEGIRSNFASWMKILK